MRGELVIFANLSHVCRFFANFCLPRIFEFVNFDGSIFLLNMSTVFRDDTTCETSRERTLCTQIAAKQPLALTLAKTVRFCYFMSWQLRDTSSWVVPLFFKTYITGMSHVKNIRELRFTLCFVGAEHWNVIATLESLEELSFNCCTFPQGPAKAEPVKRVVAKLSRLWVVGCHGPLLQQLVTAIDAQYLRTLGVDDESISHIDCASQPALTTLHLTTRQPFDVTLDHMQQLHAILMQASQSLKELTFDIDVKLQLEDIVRKLFDDFTWKKMPLLRSLGLSVSYTSEDPRPGIHQPSLSRTVPDSYPRSVRHWRLLVFSQI
jgi:hypothetical protein